MISLSGEPCPQRAPFKKTYAAAFGCLAWRLRRLRGDAAVAEAAKWMALGLLGFFLFLKVSFFNYYYVVAGLLACYALLARREPHDSHPDSSSASA